MPDPLFASLLKETTEMTWASIDSVRSRARRRVRARVATVSVAAAVAVGLTSGGVVAARFGDTANPPPGATGPIGGAAPRDSTPPGSTPPGSTPPGSTPAGRTPPGSASTSPSSAEPTEIVAALFLRPGDAGPGYRVAVGGGEGGSGDWTFEFTASMLDCRGSSAAREVAREERGLRRGAPQDDDGLVQYVARYRPGGAARYLDDVRDRVGDCRPGAGRSVRVVAQRFAGQDALLIQVDYGDGFTTKHVLVRQGDLLTEFFTKPERRSAAAQELGRKAALRLCAGTPVC
jgi:hypothetical protein